jgi:hypothetical protein
MGKHLDANVVEMGATRRLLQGPVQRCRLGRKAERRGGGPSARLNFDRTHAHVAWRNCVVEIHAAAAGAKAMTKMKSMEYSRRGGKVLRWC